MKTVMQTLSLSLIIAVSTGLAAVEAKSKQAKPAKQTATKQEVIKQEVIKQAEIKQPPMPPSLKEASSGKVTVDIPEGASSDEKELRAQAVAYAAAYARGDARALASMWAEDGTYTLANGKRLSGRKAIESFFASDLAHQTGQELDISITALNFPSETLAIEEGTTRIRSGPDAGALSRYMVVHVKKDGKWQMAAVSEDDQSPLSTDSIEDLSWLVGDWSFEGPLGSMQARADWAGGQHNFIRMMIASEDGKKFAVQVIGLDPLTGRLKSWHFAPGGGYGTGLWVRDGETWLETAESVEPDGCLGSSINILKRMDDRTFSWHSTGRFLSGKQMPDTPEITLSRKQ